MGRIRIGVFILLVASSSQGALNCALELQGSELWYARAGVAVQKFLGTDIGDWALNKIAQEKMGSPIQGRTESIEQLLQPVYRYFSILRKYGGLRHLEKLVELARAPALTPSNPETRRILETKHTTLTAVALQQIIGRHARNSLLCDFMEQFDEVRNYLKDELPGLFRVVVQCEQHQRGPAATRNW